MKKSDEQHYVDVLLAFHRLLACLDAARRDHEDCEGCPLCFTAEGSYFTADLFRQELYAECPWPAMQRVDELTGVPALPTVASLVPVPPLAPVPAKAPSPVKPRPYWLPEGS